MLRQLRSAQSGVSNVQVFLGIALCLAGVSLATFSALAEPLLRPELANASGATDFTSSFHGSSPNGMWSVVPSPNSGTNSNELRTVTCASRSNCWAVGYYLSDYASQTLLEHWDGSSWTIVPSLTTSAFQNNYLIGATCVSETDCWAVGYFDASDTIGIITSTYSQTLIEHWDGSSWAIIASPNAGVKLTNYLTSIACVSASDCSAVGFYNVPASIGYGYQPLIEHWDGVAWTVTPSPAAAASEYNILSSVTCPSISNCWAVGYYYNGVAYRTLIDHWDGVSWSVVPNSPNTSLTDNDQLLSVSCASTSDCWAVGSVSFNRTLTTHWDGSSWAIVDSDPALAHSLYGVTCVSTADCRAVGLRAPGQWAQTLIEQWDGASWSIIESPNVSATEDHFLLGVTCASAIDCWTVGYYYINGAVTQTLIEHYAVPSVRVQSVASRIAHGGAGTFDVDLTSGNAIECRSGGPDGDYTLVFTFANPLTGVAGANITSGTASIVSSNIDGNDPLNYIVSLTGVVNAQTISVTLTNVSDSAGGLSSAISAQMGILIGDVNASGRVDAADVSSVRQQTLQAITNSNFRNDINASGRIDAADVSMARQQTLTSLP